jgi:hypothetical protein
MLFKWFSRFKSCFRPGQYPPHFAILILLAALLIYFFGYDSPVKSPIGRISFSLVLVLIAVFVYLVAHGIARIRRARAPDAKTGRSWDEPDFSIEIESHPRKDENGHAHPKRHLPDSKPDRPPIPPAN